MEKGSKCQKWKRCHPMKIKILSERRNVLNDLARLLLQKESVQGEALRRMLSEFRPVMAASSPGRICGNAEVEFP
jgi:hypothetical protein